MTVLDRLLDTSKSELQKEFKSELLTGCREIYAPGDKAFEYSPFGIVPYHNCGFGCPFCFVVPGKAKVYAARFPYLTWKQCLDYADDEFRSGAKPVPGFMERYLRDLELVDGLGVKQISMSYQSDAYPKRPINCIRTREIIKVTHDRTNCGIMCITKNSPLALRDIDLFDPERDAHMFTCVSLDDDYTRKWERYTPLPAARIAAAKRFKDEGGTVIQSCEPVLNASEALAAMGACYAWVDGIYLGPLSIIGHQEMKGLPLNKQWRQQEPEEYQDLVNEAIERFGDKLYVKDGLDWAVPDSFKEQNLRNMWRQLR
jgi:DNA repair photolyase